MKKGTIVMLGAGAGAGYGYFYLPANGQRLRNTVNIAVLGGFLAFGVMAVIGDEL